MSKKRFIYQECPNCEHKLITPNSVNICFVNYGFKKAEYYYCLNCKSCYNYLGKQIMTNNINELKVRNKRKRHL